MINFTFAADSRIFVDAHTLRYQRSSHSQLPGNAPDPVVERVLGERRVEHMQRMSDLSNRD